MNDSDEVENGDWKVSVERRLTRIEVFVLVLLSVEGLGFLMGVV